MVSEASASSGDADSMDSSRRVSIDVERRVEFVPARIPKLVTAAPVPVPSPSQTTQALQADLLELARALEQVNVQRKKLLGKSASQPSVRLEPLEAKQKPSTNNCECMAKFHVVSVDLVCLTQSQLAGCDSFTDLIQCGCGEEIRRADERFHAQHECPLRMIRCVRPGCTQLFQACNRERHEQRDCQFTRHTRQLLRDRDDGDTPVECELCHETRVIIRKRFLKSHQLYMCVKRKVACRFAEWGCEMKFPQEEQEAHEASQCVVAERRRKIAADSVLVNEEIVCDWCQQKVKKRKLLDHQEDECPERERPCPNAVNGCKEWVPVGKTDEHLRMDCVVTIERNTLAAKAREKNSPVTCPECGVVVRLRYLNRHFRDECVSRVVPCKNAAHGCKARLRWRDRYLHEDFLSLSKDRSMLQFKTGGNASISVSNSQSQTPTQSPFDLPPPWTAEYFVWMVDAEEEILSLHKSSMELMEIVAVNTSENAQWQAKSDACKTKLKELKQQRKRKTNDKAQGTHLSGEEMSSAAKELAEDFNDAENGLLSTREEIALARGWIEIKITEAKRIFDTDVSDQDAKQALCTAIAEQTVQVLKERLLLVQLLPEADRALLSDLDAWAKQLTPGSPTKEDKAERQRKAAEQNKLLKKRSELQAQSEALDPHDADNQRLQRRYEREIAKVDAKLAFVSENKPTQLLERCGRHIIASSAKNVISLVAGAQGEIVFYRPSGAKAARDVNFQARLERNRWNHVVFSAGAKELSLVLNGELRNVRRGVFDLPMSRIGTKEPAESFQGYVQEVRYWNECRSLQQIQQNAASILHVAKCRTLLGYWTFEEGMGDLVDDMSLKLPRSACLDTDWVLYDSPHVRKRFGTPPTPSLRDQTCCAVNQTLKLLAQRARDRELDVAPCRQHCEQVVAYRDLERHHRVECVHRLVVCKEVGCEAAYRLSSAAEHLRSTCARHLLRDELVRRYHEKRELVECILNCPERVQRRVLALHCHTACVNRLVSCPWADCGETVIAKTLTRHLERDCRSVTKATREAMAENGRRRQQEKETDEAECETQRRQPRGG
ncbi:Peroxisomal NADH pyrophosphatase nudt12 [Phytophthora pseudosyringae]|uniref:Peroxisomal NADH pyrophosphatase nudt12 n=1 Tax=Phytophthora pseudosyringae TaxID=221518 RepID=A0A8T1VBV7_9STRA|nr:Peroxisomal NADH pyrophosphatase nudt12 [Phytophthora pseudosyringae]